jgi:DNA topoisomerase-3
MQKNEISHDCKKCGFSLPFVYRGRRISEQETEELSTASKTVWRDGWTRKDTKGTLCGRLVLSNNTLSFEAKTLSAKCPKCGSAIYKDKKKWRCSKCEFCIGETLFGRKMSQEDIEKLLFFKYSDSFDNFVSSSSKKLFSGCISIEEDFNLKMNFI